MNEPQTLPQLATAVILCGAESGRLVAGLANLDRLVLTALAAGVRRVLVLGPRPQADRALLRASSFEHGEIVVLLAGSAEETEELRGVEAAGEPFFLLHSELVLDPRYLQRLRDASKPGEPTLVVGSERAGSHPLSVGVRTAGEWIAAVDPGAATPWLGAGVLPAAAAIALCGGMERAATGLRALAASWAEQGRARVFMGGPGHASIPGSALDLRAAEAALVRSAAKDSDGFVARHLNRRISRAVSLKLLKTRVTPNVLTLGTLILAVLTAWVLAQGWSWSFVLGAFLYQLNSTLDGCDGEIARVKFLTSKFGEWADTICDQIANFSFALALPIGLYRLNDRQPLYLWLGAAVAVSLAVTLLLVYFKTRKVSDAGHFNDYGRSLVRGLKPRSAAARVLAVVTHLMRRDFYALLFLVLAVARAEAVILYLLAAGAVLHLLSLLLPQASQRPEPG